MESGESQQFETSEEEHLKFINDIERFIKEQNLQVQLLCWSGITDFIEEYQSPKYAIFRGIHDLSSEGMKAILSEGMLSRLLTKYDGDNEKVRSDLVGKNIDNEFLTHYKGAGKGDLFWQSHNDSPFVGASCGPRREV